MYSYNCFYDFFLFPANKYFIDFKKKALPKAVLSFA